MPVTFDTMVHFWIALIKTFRMIYNVFGFEEVRILPLFLVMTSFLINGFPKLHTLLVLIFTDFEVFGKVHENLYP